MNLVMTLLARNEADIVDEQIAFHLNAGVDFVIATDNQSDDETDEILERYAAQGYLHLIREEQGGVNHQSRSVTRMAQLAARKYNADWVINTDADEFWSARGASLKTILAKVPKRYATVRAFLRNYVPRAGGDACFAERMTARLVPSRLPPSSPFHAHPFQPQEKVAHRGHPDVRVMPGNHDAHWNGSVDLRGWWPIEVLHFPLRSAEQCERKWRNWQRFMLGPPADRHPAFAKIQKGGPRDYYRSLLVDDESLKAGLLDGSFAIDTRLRNVLDALRVASRSNRIDEAPFYLPSERMRRVGFPPSTLEEDAIFAADLTSASERDSILRASRSVERLESRIELLEKKSLLRGFGRFVRSRQQTGLAREQ